MASLSQRIAGELNAQEWQVQAAIDLLDSGATVPFIARYRKEATGTLDDAQLRTLDERLRYLRELEERRTAILASIESQGKLDDALRRQILAAETKARLEDLYLPYKPKRRTKAQIARKAGLEPLAESLLAHPERDPKQTADTFVDAEKGIATVDAALEGAREPDKAECEGALGDVIDEPADRDRLHLLGQPRRDPHAGEQREVAMTKDGQARSSSFFIWAGHCNAHCAIVSTKGRRLASVISHRPDPRPVLSFLSVINRAAGTLFLANLLGQEAQQRGVETFRRSR